MAEYIDLPASNLYTTGFIIIDDGIETLERTPLSIKPEWNDRWYIVQNGDELDGLAQQFYNGIAAEADKHWWILAEANGITNPLDIAFMEGYYMLIPDFFRVKNLVQAIQNGDIPFDDAPESNIYQIIDNPPVPLNPPDEPTDQPGGNEDTPGDVDKWLFLKRPNGGGFILVSADKYGGVISEKANPNDYANPVIFQPKPA